MENIFAFLICLRKEGGQVLDKLELNPIRLLSEDNMSDFSNYRGTNIVTKAHSHFLHLISYCRTICIMLTSLT